MDVIDTKPLLLSNWEVYHVLLEELQEQDAAALALQNKCKQRNRDRIAQGKEAIPYDNAKEAARLVRPENVHSIQKATVDWLADPELVTARQTAKQVTQLTQDLAAFDRSLTKAEILQLVNTMPQSLAELYVIIDQFEDRLDEERREQLFDLVQGHPLSKLGIATLPARPAPDTMDVDDPPPPAPETEEPEEEEEAYPDTDEEEEDALFLANGPGRSTQNAELDIDEQAES